MKKFHPVLALLLSAVLVLSGCGTTDTIPNNSVGTQQESIGYEEPVEVSEEPTAEPTESDEVIEPEQQTTPFSISSIPAYSGKAYVAVNNNIPYFVQSDLTTTSFEKYSSLDSLGRCGVVYANIGRDIMPTEERGSIGMVKPSGWHTVKYDNVDGKYLYNRCHLIGFQLSGENANTRNLITGTRYMNMQGMLPFENMVADYVKETNNHVLYRVTPVFESSNLVATGVLMEGLSVEDNGAGISFNVFCYNVQPGISIDYATGNSEAVGGSAPSESSDDNNKQPSSSASSYIGNKNTKKFHIPSCSSVGQMKESNKDYLNCTRNEAISRGYDPCGRCHP